MLDSLDLEPDDVLSQSAAEQSDSGATVVYVVADDRIEGLIAVADPVKTGAKRAIEALHASGIKTAMITGNALRLRAT